MRVSERSARAGHDGERRPVQRGRGHPAGRSETAGDLAGTVAARRRAVAVAIAEIHLDAELASVEEAHVTRVRHAALCLGREAAR